MDTRADAEIIVDVALENASDRSLFEEGYRDETEIRQLTVKAVVDTGVAMLVLPQDIVSGLGIRTRGVESVSGRRNHREDRPVAGGLTLRIGDRAMTTDCVIGPSGSETRIGRIILQVLDLKPDCAGQALSVRPESPDRPLLRM